jgi:hypothetical protein
MAKPFFSIRIDYNPADSDEMEAFDSNTLRLALARETEKHDDDGERNYETFMNMGMRIGTAIKWLAEIADRTSPTGKNRVALAVMLEMRMGFWEQFIDEIRDVAEGGDDDQVEAMKAAIAAGERAATGEEDAK